MSFKLTSGLVLAALAAPACQAHWQDPGMQNPGVQELHTEAVRRFRLKERLGFRSLSQQKNVIDDLEGWLNTFVNDLTQKVEDLFVYTDQHEYPNTAEEILTVTLSDAWKQFLQYLSATWQDPHSFVDWNSQDATSGLNKTGVFQLFSPSLSSFNLTRYNISTNLTNITFPQISTLSNWSSTDYFVEALAQPEAIRFALLSDWASGTRESALVSAQASLLNPHYTAHAGDLYVVGTPAEAKANCLGIAPAHADKGVQFPLGSVGSFAIPGDHEYFSGGGGYFDTWLPNLGFRNESNQFTGQNASYLALENEYWRILFLDNAYSDKAPYTLGPEDGNVAPFVNRETDKPLQDSEVAWLNNTLHLWNESDTRGLIVMTHFAALDPFLGGFLDTPKQLASLLPANRTVLWFSGHSHHVTLHANQTLNFTNSSIGVLQRIIGNGGYPTQLDTLTYANETALVVSDERELQYYPSKTGLQNTATGYYGFAHLVLVNDTALIEYYTLDAELDPDTNYTSYRSANSSSVIMREVVKQTEGGSVYMDSLTIFAANLTVNESALESGLLSYGNNTYGNNATYMGATGIEPNPTPQPDIVSQTPTSSGLTTSTPSTASPTSSSSTPTPPTAPGFPLPTSVPPTLPFGLSTLIPTSGSKTTAAPTTGSSNGKSVNLGAYSAAGVNAPSVLLVAVGAVLAFFRSL